MVRLAGHIALGGVLLAQLGHGQRGGGVVAKHHHGVFAFGLQHHRNPRHAGELAQLDGVHWHALFHHHIRCGNPVAGFPNLHHHRAALGGEPQVDACRLCGNVQDKGLGQWVERTLVSPFAAGAAVLRDGTAGLRAEHGATTAAAVARVPVGQWLLGRNHLLQRAQHGGALAHEGLTARAAQGAGEQHGFGARCDVFRNGEGARQLARGGALQRAAWQRLACHRNAVERDGTQRLARPPAFEVKPHGNGAQVFQLAGGFRHRARLLFRLDGACAGVQPLCDRAGPGRFHFGPAVHVRRERDGGRDGVKRLVRIDQHGARAHGLRQHHAVAVRRGLALADGLAQRVHGGREGQL